MPEEWTKDIPEWPENQPDDAPDEVGSDDDDDDE
jgi:hypothetical protein